MTGTQIIKQGLDLLDHTINEFDPRNVIAMFSGGHDSLVSTHIASQHPRFSFALHINTGIGIEQTREFVRQTCGEWGIELREYRAAECSDPQVYDDIVREYGFPGADQHRIMYVRLKERPLRQALRDLNRQPKDKTLLITGARSQESMRRMRHVKPVQIWEGTKIWVAPIWNFNKLDVGEYIRTHGLRRNEVVDLLHMSGECLCGAFAHEGEKEEIRQWFPEVASRIDQLENEITEKFPWGWENGPPEWWKEYKHGQKIIPGLETLCWSCDKRRNDQ